MTRSPEVQFIDRAQALKWLPVRDVRAHKWGVGGLVIVGGAPGYIGAPALAAMAAGRSGAGIVSLAIPRSSVAATATLVPEAVFLPLPETDTAHGVGKASEAIRAQVEKSHALVVGPGLSRDEMAAALLGALFGESSRSTSRSLGFAPAARESEESPSEVIVGGDKPAVIDADALHWLAQREAWWIRSKPFSLVLTPHVGELAALQEAETDAILEDPAGAALQAATDWQQYVVLKAGRTYISDGDTVRTTASAAPALATAGSGDVLAGSIGAFLAQGLAPFDAASLAIYAGTEAALNLTRELSSLGVVAGDLPIAIARVLAELQLESAGDA